MMIIWQCHPSLHLSVQNIRPQKRWNNYKVYHWSVAQNGLMPHALMFKYGLHDWKTLTQMSNKRTPVGFTPERSFLPTTALWVTLSQHTRALKSTQLKKKKKSPAGAASSTSSKDKVLGSSVLWTAVWYVGINNIQSRTPTQSWL